MTPATAALLVVAQLAPLDSGRVELELMRAHAIMPSQIEFSDDAFVLPDQAWIETEFLPYFRAYLDAMGAEPSGEGMDCDNYAQIFKQQLALCNARGGRATAGDVPCAVVKAQQVLPFGGVPGDGSRHSVALLRTSAGWQIVEPQTGAITPLEAYPNRAYIDWALF